VLADYIGPHKIMWATDYPHRDGFFPGAPQMLRDRLGRLSPEAKAPGYGRGCDGVPTACSNRITLHTGLQALGYALWDSDLERLVPFRFAALG
jgi:hypothetical protein